MFNSIFILKGNLFGVDPTSTRSNNRLRFAMMFIVHVYGTVFRVCKEGTHQKRSYRFVVSRLFYIRSKQVSEEMMSRAHISEIVDFASD